MRFDGGKVHRARELVGYGYDTTAEEAKVSKNSVIRAERGEEIRPSAGRKIAAALGVRVADLLKEETPDPLAGAHTSVQPPINGFLAETLPDDLQAARDRLIELRTKWVERRTSETGALSEAALEALEDELNQLGPFLQATLEREKQWLRSQYPNEWDLTDRAVVGPEVGAYVQLFRDALNAKGATAEPETAAVVESLKSAS